MKLIMRKIKILSFNCFYIIVFLYFFIVSSANSQDTNKTPQKQIQPQEGIGQQIKQENQLVTKKKPQLFSQGDLETNFSLTIGSMRDDVENQGDKNSTTTSEFSLFLSPEFYIFDGLSIGPEIGATMFHDQKSMQSLSIIGNISYTIFLPDNNIAPFFKIGYGFSNCIKPFVNSKYQVKIIDGFDVNVTNLGAGIKFLIGESTFLKTELNYRTSTCEKVSTLDINDVKLDYSITHLSILAGISIIF